MSIAKQVWVFRGSRAAGLVRSLRRRYKIRVAEPTACTKASGVTEDGNSPAEINGPAVWLLDPSTDPVSQLRRIKGQNPQIRFIAVANTKTRHRKWFACIPHKARPEIVRLIIDSAFQQIAMVGEVRKACEEVTRAEREQDELNRIGVALSATHNVSELLKIILTKTRQVTAADAGSLYVIEDERAENGSSTAPQRRLRFRLTQNDSKDFPFTESVMPLSESSITGYAALHGEIVALDDAYTIPEDRPYHFNPSYDQSVGYRTRSLLTVPMENARGEVIGVVQLVNCKRDPAARLLTPADTERFVQPFSARAIRLAESLASQAAVAYENSRLYQDIESLFEGFVGAAVTAIEQRDPTTSGHSMRVSRMTCGLAEVVDRSSGGTYSALHFTPDQMKEIRYAALLHDFGKVAVREDVLVKAKKLYPAQFHVVQNRFDYVRKELEARYEKRKFRVLMDLPREQALEKIAGIDQEFRAKVAELDEAFNIILDSNEPTVLASGQFDKLFDVARQTYVDPRGVEHPLLTDDETRFLSIRKGSLDVRERQQIESHVVHSVNFLSQIPWTKTISEIPQIVRAHHEKLNGSGYPFRLKGDEIPVQARMMTICDIFDALSASDRPYKKALPAEKALSILEDSVAQQELDAELFQLFLEARIYDLSARVEAAGPLSK